MPHRRAIPEQHQRAFYRRVHELVREGHAHAEAARLAIEQLGIPPVEPPRREIEQRGREVHRLGR